MKKTLLGIIVLATMTITGTTMKAQSFEQGMSNVSIGIGFPNVFKSIYSIYEIYGGYDASGFGPINVKYEYALTDQLGLGVNFSYLSYKVSWDYVGTGGDVFAEGYKGSLLALLVRGNYHFATGDKLDPYVGIGVGYIGYNFDYFNDDPNFNDDDFLSLDYGAPFGYSASVGARYYFTDNIGAYAELGWDGLALMQIGLTVGF